MVARVNQEEFQDIYQSMKKMKDAIYQSNDLFKKTDNNAPHKTHLNLTELSQKVFPIPMNKIKQSKPVQQLQNLTHHVSQSMESIDRLNRRIQNIDDKNEPLLAEQLINPVKRSPRNSILPYSVFEDYLLFKCYLDKPTDPGKTHMRTRQSGHLGRDEFCRLKFKFFAGFMSQDLGWLFLVYFSFKILRNCKIEKWYQI